MAEVYSASVVGAQCAPVESPREAQNVDPLGGGGIDIQDQMADNRGRFDKIPAQQELTDGHDASPIPVVV